MSGTVEGLTEQPWLQHGACAPSTVPGWWLDHPVGFAAGCPMFAARVAEVVQGDATARHATVLLARDDAAARRALGALGRLEGPANETPEVVLVRVQGSAALALVLPPWIGETARPPAPPAPPPSPAPGSPAPPASGTEVAPGRRAPVWATACAVALCVLVVAAVGGRRTLGRGDAATSDPPAGEVAETVEWDADRAIATVTVAGRARRYAIGSPGDQLLAGDWDGDGARTPALYRTATGEVWEFERWANDDEAVAARLLRTMPAGGVVRVVRDDGRDRLELAAPAD